VNPEQLERKCPPGAFFFLHVCTAWPVGVIGLALGSSLVKAGVAVHQAATIIAASNLAFTLEFAWAPIVDSSLTRRFWYVVGAGSMCIGLAWLILAPWNAASVPLMTSLAFASSSGAAIAAVAVKGIMAYEVPRANLGSASGFYTAGGTFAKAVAGAGTLWLLTHLTSRAPAAGVSLALAVLAGAAILLVAPGWSPPLQEFPARVGSALKDLFALLCTRAGVMIAVLCAIPFGSGTEAGLIGAIAHEWAVSPDQLASFSVIGAVMGVAGAVFAGWLSTRIGTWKTYVLVGWSMIAVMVVFAAAPRTANFFLGMELIYRTLASGGAAALLGMIMAAIGMGAASTKAAALWSLANLSLVMPTYVEGQVHDRLGTQAMLLTDAGLGIAGFAVLLVVSRWVKFRSDDLAERHI
jgi:MFS transporter, PAT family, beta-lactamase induction signal transducer AmpG